MPHNARERQLLLALKAFHRSLLDGERLAAVCQAWLESPDLSVSEFLVARGWLDPGERSALEPGATQPSAAVSLAEQPTTDEAQSRRSSQEELTTAHEDSEAGSADGERPPHPGNQTRYERLRLHASGGIGHVWLAMDENLHREVALKELQPGRATSTTAAGRFLREARITGQLEHPGVVPVYELVRQADTCYYTMRFIRGRTLSEAIQGYHRRRAEGREGPLDLRELLQAFVTVCNTIAYAHARGVIHRDLKGNNIVLGDFGEVIVLDWGLARELEEADGEEDTDLLPFTAGAEGETADGQVLGTPAFMAPEQAEGRKGLVDRLSDVYGLGAMLYQVLTGKPPYRGTDPLQVLRQLREGSPPPPRTLNPAAPAALEAVCLRAMSRRKEDRYPSARALAEDVQHWLADEPVSAYAEPAAERAGRWARRHRTAVAAAAVLLATAALGLGLTAALVTREKGLTEGARRIAQANFEEAEEQRARAVANANRAEQERRRADEKRQEADAHAAVAQQRKEEAERSATEARLQEEAATAQRQRAEANFLKAREAVDKMLTRVGDERLRNVPQMEKLRKELLEEALAFYQDFLKQKGTDPLVQLETARAHGRLAEIRRLMGQHEEAIEDVRKAIELFAALVASDRDKRRYRADLAASHLDLGNLLEFKGLYPEAGQNYDRATALLLDLVKEADSPAIQRLLSNAYNVQGSLNQVQRKVDDALAHYRKAEAIRRKMHEDDPLDPSARFHLAQVHYNYGNLYSRERRNDEAEKAYSRALDLLVPVAKEYPDEADYQDTLAVARVNLGNLCQATDRLAEAERQFKTAIPTLETLIQQFPGFPDFRAQLAMCYYNLGNLRYQERNLEEAGRYYLLALPIREKLVAEYPTGRPQYRDDLVQVRMNYANILQYTGRQAEAEKQFLETLAYLGKHRAEWHDEQEWKRREGVCRANLGNLCQEQGRLREAERYYREALPIQQKLEEGESADRGFREDLAQTYLHLGNVLQDTGRFDEADKAFGECARRAEKLHEEFPRAQGIARLLGMTYYNQGNLYSLGRRLRDAEGYYRKALAVQEALVAADKDHYLYRGDLAGTHLNYGNVYQDTRRYADAEKSFLACIRLAEKLLTEKPDDLDNQRRLGITYYNLGNLIYEQDHDGKDALEKADGWYRKALKIQVPLAEKLGRPQDHHDLAATQLNHGNILQYSGKVKEAEKAFDATIASAERACKDQPNDVLSRRQLGVAYGNRGNLLSHEGRYAEARDSYRKAIEYQEKLAALRGSPRARDFQFDLASTLNNLAMLLGDCPDEKLRDPKEGLALAEQAVKLVPTAGGTWNTAGICRYRKGDLKEARADFGRSMALRNGGDSNDWYFLAMIEWQTGDKGKARDWFDRARKWYRQNGADDPALKRYDAEAAKLLEIK